MLVHPISRNGKRLPGSKEVAAADKWRNVKQNRRGQNLILAEQCALLELVIRLVHQRPRRLETDWEISGMLCYPAAG